MTTQAADNTPLQIAQNRVAKAALMQPMNPNQAAISAYVNTILQSCRLDALTELWLNPPNGSWTPQEALEDAIVRALNKKAEMLQSALNAIQVPQGAPKLHLVS